MTKKELKYEEDTSYRCCKYCKNHFWDLGIRCSLMSTDDNRVRGIACCNYYERENN